MPNVKYDVNQKPGEIPNSGSLYFEIATSSPPLDGDAQLKAFYEFNKMRELFRDYDLLRHESPGFPVTDADKKLIAWDSDFKHVVRRGKQGIAILFKHNQQMVINLASQHQASGKKRNLSLTDLIALGNDGLLRAVYKFNPEKQAKFNAYAYWWIMQSIAEGITRASLIRVPQKQQSKYTFTFQTCLNTDDSTVDIFDRAEPSVKGSLVDEMVSVLNDSEVKFVCDFLGIGGNEDESRGLLELSWTHGVDLGEISNEFHRLTDKMLQSMIP